MALPPEQITVLLGVILSTGRAFTVTVTVAVFEQDELVKVPITVYVVFTLGLTLMVFVAGPVFHTYVLAPAAVNEAF